jgi:predicted amidohydrolase
MNCLCIQGDVFFGNRVENYHYYETQIKEGLARFPQTDVVILPEMWTTGYDLRRIEELAEHPPYAQLPLYKWAKTHQVFLIGGSVPSKINQQYFNTMLIYNPFGELVHSYSKAHLFQLMNEHHFLSAGNGKGSFIINNIACAGVICYDIRFPEWIRTHTVSGDEVVFVVAQWPLARLNHWRVLLQARAIENQCYIVACNRSGSDPSNQFAGHSMVITPWGEIEKECDTEASFLAIKLDLNKVKEVRKGIPIFNDRRKELYE